MGKFSLLTSLTVNAVGFDKGIDKASTKVASFKKGTEQASQSIGSSFSSMGDVLGGAVGSQVGMLGTSVMSGVGAFKSMIPAINGVKMALISSGIGAIVVAIGIAFGALASYLTGTAEGSEKLNIFLGYLKGSFNAIIKRVNSFGSALASLLAGDFSGFKKNIDDTFKGGLFDEIKSDAKQFSAFAKEENDLKADKIRLQKTILDLTDKENNLNMQMKNKNLSSDERKKALADVKAIGDQKDKIEIGLLTREYNLQEKINKSKGKSISYEEQEKLNEIYGRLIAKKAEILQGDTMENRVQSQLSKSKIENEVSYIDAIDNSIKALEQRREILYSEGKDISGVTTEISTKKTEKTTYENNIKGLDMRDAGELVNLPDKKDVEEYINDYVNDLEIEPIEVTIAPIPVDSFNGIMESVGALTGAITGALEQSSTEYKAFAIAQALISTYLAAAAIMANTAKLGPIAMGISMAATITAGLINVAKIATFATGGIVGGNSFRGDNVMARVNSGEMILNSSQQAQLFSLANGGSAGAGEVRFEIEGSKLIGVLNNYNRKTNSYR